jgi:Protein of unknown function (DUF3460)
LSAFLWCGQNHSVLPVKIIVYTLQLVSNMSALLNAISRIFYRPAYSSDASNFITDLKRNRPTLEAEQRAGRALLWDKNVDRTALADSQAASVAQQAYVYGSSPK